MAEELPANTRGRVQRCVGSACTVVGQMGSMAGTFVKDTAYPVISSKAGELGSMAGTFLKNTAYPAVSTCVGDSCLYALARVIGYNPTFSNGLAITANDRGIVDAINSKKNHEVFHESKLAFAKKLSDLIEGKLEVMDDPDTEDVELYKNLAKDAQLQGIVKGLYLLHLTSMGRPLETLKEPAVASILMQANLGPHDSISFDTSTNLKRVLFELGKQRLKNLAKVQSARPAPLGGWFAIEFSRGPDMLPSDTDRVASIINAKNTDPTIVSRKMSEYRQKLVELLEQKIENMANNVDDSNLYVDLTREETLRGLVKGMYMLHLANTRQDVVAPNDLSVASILMQVHRGSQQSPIVFDRVNTMANLARVEQSLRTQRSSSMASQQLKLPPVPPGGWFGTGANKKMGGGKRNTRHRKNRKQKRRTHRR